jgi:hypothetical protein
VPARFETYWSFALALLAVVLFELLLHWRRLLRPWLALA